MLDRLKRAFGRTVQPGGATDVRARVLRLIKTGPRPEQVFLGVPEHGRTLTFQYPEQQGPTMLLFSTGYYCADYLSGTGVEADVAHFQLGALPKLAKRWIEAGAVTFVLNRCPRCSAALIGSTQNLLSEEGFLQHWATDRVVRAYKGEQLTRTTFAAIGSGDMNKALKTLNEIRDHVDCGIPQLYQMIAVIAELQGLEQDKAAALHRLGMFGPAHEPRFGLDVNAMTRISNELLVHFQQCGSY